MKYIIFTILISFLLIPTHIDAANDSRFDWTLGQPAVMEDTTAICSDTATIRYDWVLGQPAPVFNATANCTSAEPPATGGEELFIIIID